MINLLSYNDVKSYYYNRSFGGRKEQSICEIFQKAEKVINEKDIFLFYPKNLFVEDKPFELYLFSSDNRIVKCTVENETYISTTVFNTNRIASIKGKENSIDYSDRILFISFKNGENVEFNSSIDTNSSHKNNFSNLIEQIFKHITLQI